MKHLLRLFLVSSLCLIVAFASSGASNAVSGSDWRAGRIIDDLVFMNKNSMTVEQIQSFLNSKVPVCETNHAEDSSWRDMGPPYVCLKDFKEDPNIPIRNCTQQEVAVHFGFGPENPNYQAALNYCWWKDGRANIKGQAVGPNAQSAAQIIWQVAQDYTINPQVLIVTLQKEQSLITDTWPWVGNFQKAMGYACPDTAACDPGKRGFYNQVRNAAFQLRRYVDYPQNYNFAVGNRFIQYNPNSGCGGTNVNIETAGTAALYNYTPYQPNQAALNNLYGTGDGCSAYGNRNFWRLFNDWFGSTQVSGKWLRQGPDGQVWLVVEGLMPDNSYARKRFKLTNWDVYQAYFLQYEPVVPVPNEYLSQFTDDGSLGALAIGRSYAQIQFANSGYRYYVPDTATCTAWGFDCFNANVVKTIPGTEFLERLTGTAQPVPPVMEQGGTVYKMQAGNKLPIVDGQTFTDLGYSWGNVLYNTQAINAAQPLGPLQISHQIVIQFNPSSPVVVYDPTTSKFHKVANYELFLAWGMQHYAILNPPASSFSTSPPTVSSPDLTIWATDGNGNKYMIDQGRKINVTDSVDMPSVTWHSIGKDLLNLLPTAVYGRYSMINETGKVYFIESGQKRLVPNWNNFVGLGLSIPQLLPLTNYTANQFADGEFKLADSSIFETNSGVWMVNGLNKLHIPLYAYFGYFNLDPAARITGQATLDNGYNGTVELSVLIKDSAGNKFVMQNGTRLSIDSATIANWGLGSVSFLQLSDKNLSRLPVVGSLGRFINVPNHGLYYADGGQKHHIDSYASYQALGGNPNNTFVVAEEFFNACPQGAPIP